MDLMTIGPWRIQFDREATAEAYAQIDMGAEECSREHCQHWAANREQIYPEAARRLLDEMGINYRLETEVVEDSPLTNHRMCSGWFEFVGRLVSGPRTKWVFAGHSGTGTEPAPFDIADGFGVWLSGDYQPMRHTFRQAAAAGRPVEAIRFCTTRHEIQ